MALVRAATFSPVNQADTFEIQRQKINALAIDVDAGLIDGLQYPYIYSLEFTAQTTDTAVLNMGSYGIVAFSQNQAATYSSGFKKFTLLYDVAQDRYKTSVQFLDNNTTFSTGYYGLPTQDLSLYDDFRITSPQLSAVGLTFKANTFITIQFAISPTASGIPNLVTHAYSLENRIVGTYGFVGYSLAKQFLDGGNTSGVRFMPAMYINAVRGAKRQNAISFIGRQALGGSNGSYMHNQNLNDYFLPFSEDRFAFSTFTVS